MAKLKNYNGHYCESDYEYAFLGFLEKTGWTYTAGKTILSGSFGKTGTSRRSSISLVVTPSRNSLSGARLARPPSGVPVMLKNAQLADFGGMEPEASAALI